jgi:hypothetical protein
MVGAAVTVSVGLGLAFLFPRKRESLPEGVGPLDVEALGRMFASENPRGSERLKIEQAWTQIRSKKTGQSLYVRITAGSGWGSQGERAAGGEVRPVSTKNPASENDLALARRILNGMAESTLPGARQFFEPAQQDRLFQLAKSARDKRDAGKDLTERDRHLLRYRSDADGIRKRWRDQGVRKLDDIDGVEFWG